MRFRLLVLFALTMACRRASAPEVRPDRAPVVVPVGPTAAERTACAVVEKTHADAVARLKSDAKVAPLLDKLPSLFGRCLPSTRGAFGFVLDELCVEPTKFDDGHPDADVLGRWRFVHVDGAGHLVRYEMGTGGIGGCAGRMDFHDVMTIVGTKNAPNEWLAAPEPVLFDYDGDGEEEVFVTLTSRVVQDSPESGDLLLFSHEEVHLFTFRDGAIVDATCGPTGALIARQPKGALDPDRTMANVVCARLAGSTKESVDGKLAAECATDAGCQKLAKTCVKAAFAQ